RVAATHAQASFFLGIARLHLGQTETARLSFERAAERDPSLRLAARYYEGVAEYRSGDWAGAQEHFSYVAETSPNSEMGREAAGFLARIRQGQGARYQVVGALGFQYDSNVVLAPESDLAKSELRISGESDGRATIDAGGSFVPWRSEHALLSI